MVNLKGIIIPQKIKGNIDSILEEQLFNANRYFAESNPEISRLMQEELLNSPKVYLERLKIRWNWHNIFYEELLEPSFQNLILDTDIELSPKEINDLINVYYTSCLVDEATLVMSGSIKKYLDYKCKYVTTNCEDISVTESKNMLISPPVESFFTQYQIDHLYYIYLLKFNKNESKDFLNYLLNKYHANNIEIFKNRFIRKFGNYLNVSVDEKKFLKYINSFRIPESYKIQHFYFTMEHPERKAIRDIIIFDNLNEKLIASNLIGISGFLLRKKILQYLNDSNVLKNDGYIYEFNKDIVIKSLEKLKLEREFKMDKNVKPYKQKGDTCAIVCMMMVLEYYKKMEKANWYDERRFYKIYRSKYMTGTPFSALAYHFSKNGLNTTIYHSDKNLFNNNRNVVDSNTFELAMNEYKDLLNMAKESGTSIINGIDINTALIKEELEKGNLVILAGELPGGYHAILVSGYENNRFVVCNPLYKNKQYRTEDDLDNFMSTSIGKWFISVNNITKEKNDLLNSLNNFNEESIKIMEPNKDKRNLNYEKK